MDAHSYAEQINEYVGSGFAFPLRVNVQGSVQLSSDAPNLEESILIILRTELGERVYRPFFCLMNDDFNFH